MAEATAAPTRRIGPPATYASDAPIAPAVPRSRREGIERWLRYALEAGIFFVLFEGLLRKAIPALGTPIQIFKFPYFAGLFLAALLLIRIRFRMPVALWLYLAWGIILTYTHAFRSAAEAFLGAGVNLTFIPVIFLARDLYREPKHVLAFAQRLAIFAAIAGLIAVVQSRISPDHWLNAAVVEEGTVVIAEEGVRVMSTFQWPNTFALFAGLGYIGCVLAALLGRGMWNRTWPLGAGALLAFGMLFSQSRVGVIGGAIVLVLLLVMNPAVRTRLAVPILLLVLGLLGGIFISPPAEGPPARGGDLESLEERIIDNYGRNVGAAAEESSMIGLGWGVDTPGVQYVKQAGFQSTDFRFIEGGYSVLMHQLGILGFVLFFALVASIVMRHFRTDVPYRGLAIPLAAVLVIGNIPQSILEIPVVSILVWFFVGLLMIQTPTTGGTRGGVAPLTPLVPAYRHER